MAWITVEDTPPRLYGRNARIVTLRFFDVYQFFVKRNAAPPSFFLISFTAAETTLGISRSAISQHMNDLEGRLGFSLCQRGRGGFSLTEEGKEIYQAGLTLLTALETFKSDVNALR